MTDPIDKPQPLTHDTLPHKEKFYGRRMGRPLRKQTQNLLDRALPSYTFDDTLLLDPHADFDQDSSELWLEIGCGGGEHLCGQAKQNPHINMIGAEAFMNGISLMLRQIVDDNINNIRIWPNDVRPLLDALPKNTVDRLFLLFPDPWPKIRHHKRRFVTQKNLDRLYRLMKPGAQLRIATDHADYRAWITHQMKAYQGFTPTFDWEAPPTEQPADWVPTRYETKARKDGILCTYMDFICQK